ncbi:hypothetical protein [Bradyrhizobium cajani]|uniref:Uncharacterized protein n=1 Tax=Bradyrhizobium cajani TaxID=1928661 RepID=A0A844T5V1_9BRAD|nr:hypothetical protein [Bradyrhizobium cajani]MCP3367557.1 hypothetical protein [Bradyrhizobium cajani]MVT73616.1 hypothetical protein [Bradyrhizobium cajani]
MMGTIRRVTRNVKRWRGSNLLELEATNGVGELKENGPQYQQVNHRPIQLDEQSESCLHHHRQPTNVNGGERYLPVVRAERSIKSGNYVQLGDPSRLSVTQPAICFAEAKSA